MAMMVAKGLMVMVRVLFILMRLMKMLLPEKHGSDVAEYDDHGDGSSAQNVWMTMKLKNRMNVMAMPMMMMMWRAHRRWW